MTEKSKLIAVLSEYEQITNLSKHFTEAEKRSIIEEYLNSYITKAEIRERYTGQTSQHGVLLKWKRQLDKPMPKQEAKYKKTKKQKKKTKKKWKAHKQLKNLRQLLIISMYINSQKNFS